MGNIGVFNQLATNTNTYLNTARPFSLDFQVYRRTFDDIDRKLGFRSEDRVLDLGGGCGQITKYIAAKVTEVVLADGANNTLAVAQKNLRPHANITYRLIDITVLPLPFLDDYFDHVVCYSVVHYLNNFDEFSRLVAELLRVTKPGGKILIGEIPLSDKSSAYFKERRKRPLLNFLLNVRYYCKKYLTKLFYVLDGVDDAQLKGLTYDRKIISDILNTFSSARFEFLAQDKKLPVANSREDVLIVKNLQKR